MPDPIIQSFGFSRMRTCRHGPMLYLAADQGIGRLLELYGEFAEGENWVMTKFLRPGNIALDIGANIGTVTVPLARCVGAQGRVYAFEPQRIIFQHLCANAVLNGLSNVEARCAAVGAVNGTATIPALDPRVEGLFGSTEVRNDDEGDPVPIIRVDDLDLPRCDLIKIDVEGMEADVLAGADATIAQHRPVIYFEAKKGANTRTCLDWLMARSYALYWHFAFFFAPGNFAGNSENKYGSAGDINALAVPKERGLQVNLASISGPDADWQAEYGAWLKERQRVASQKPA